MSVCNPSQFSDFFLSLPEGTAKTPENAPVGARNTSAQVVAGRANFNTTLTGQSVGSGTLTLEVQGPYEPQSVIIAVDGGTMASALVNSMSVALNSRKRNYLAFSSPGTPNSGTTGNFTLIAKDYGQIGNQVSFKWTIEGFTGISLLPSTVTTWTNLVGGCGAGDSPHVIQSRPSEPDRTTNDINAQAVFAAKVADIINDLSIAEGIIGQLLPVWNGIDGFVAGLEGLNNIDASLSTVADVKKFIDNLNSAGSAIGQIKSLVNMLPRNEITTAAMAGLDYLNDHGVQPLVQWAQAASGLAAFDISGIDLTNADGSLDALRNYINASFQGIGKIFPPWEAVGQEASTWVGGIVDTWENIVKVNDEIGQLLKDAADMALAAQSLLTAACELIPAIVAQMKKLLNAIFALFHMNFNFNFSFNLFSGFHFKFPSLPNFLHLAEWQGLFSALDGFGGVFAKCGAILMGDPFQKGGFAAPNFNALAEGMAALGQVKDKFSAGTVGIGAVTNGITTSIDPIKAIFDTTPSLLTLAPTGTTITPEASSLLANLAGGVAGSNADTSKLPAGVVDCRTSNLTQNVTEDGQPLNIAGMPGPFQALEAGSSITKDLFSSVGASNVLGSVISETAARMNTLGHNATEAEAIAALDQFISATGLQMAIRNLAYNHTLDPASLAQATAKYWACKNAEDHQSPVPGSPHDFGNNDPTTGAPGGNTGTPLASAASNNPDQPAPTPGGLLDDPVAAGLPSGYMNTSIALLINSYSDPSNNIIDYTSLPYFFITPTQNALTGYRNLKLVDNILKEIMSDPTKLADHLTILSRARQQFIAANSPYAWLARGCEILGGFLDTNNNPMSLMDLVQGLLVHDARNLLTLANWLDSLENIDFEVPISSGLTANQEALADASYQYVNTNRSIGLVGVLTELRMNADTIGHSLGFEYCLVLATFVLMNRMRNLLASDKRDPDLIAAIAAEAHKYVSAMTNGDDFLPLLDALVNS